MTPEELKRRYQEHWARSNQRERFVKLFLDVYLPKPFKAELVGLGAGSEEYINRSYNGVLEAFDIIIYYNSRPAVFVDVTGLSSPREGKPKLGYCIGEWKLGKAVKHGVLNNTWFAFVLEDEPTILWAPAQKFQTIYAKTGKLYGDERPVRCLPRARWLRWARFKAWLVQYAPIYASYLVKAARG